jgi:DNA mismatch endonuclease (patch repair protein)
MDRVSVEKRSSIMRAVHSKNTTPELAVRKILTRLGYRYRLHRKDLAGRPDIVFAGRKKVIFVHGCFWHGHDCKKGRTPDIEYWQNKLKTNISRDASNVEKLVGTGWSVLTIWQCELKDLTALEKRLSDFLKP